MRYALFLAVLLAASEASAVVCDVAEFPASGTLTAERLNQRIRQLESCVNRASSSASVFIGTGSLTDAVDLATLEVNGILPVANLPTTVYLTDGTRVITGSIIMEGATANDFEVFLAAADPTADVTLTFPAVTATICTTAGCTFTGPVSFAGTTTTFAANDIADAEVVDTITAINYAPLAAPSTFTEGAGLSPFVFEGAVADANETTLAFAEPTADRTITFKDQSGTVALTSDLEANPWTLVSKTVTETITSDSVVNDDSTLVVSVAANTTYRIRIHIFIETTAAADFTFNMNGPASPTKMSCGVTAITESASVASDALSDYVAQINMAWASGTVGHAQVNCTFHNGANAGTFTFAWAQTTSTAVDTSVLKGSYLEWDAL